MTRDSGAVIFGQTPSVLALSTIRAIVRIIGAVIRPKFIGVFVIRVDGLRGTCKVCNANDCAENANSTVVRLVGHESQDDGKNEEENDQITCSSIVGLTPELRGQTSVRWLFPLNE